MQCPICQADNPPTAVSCMKCTTPLPFSDQTLGGTAVGGTSLGGPASDATSMGNSIPGGTAAWSVAVTPPASASAAQGEQLVGTMLADRYEIIALLGQGGMGAVYKARDTELDRLVAIKLIRPDLASNPEILRRFKQELILAREVTHRNVIRIFDLGQSRGLKFITMEFVEGRDLRVVLRERGKLPPEEAVRIISQVCRALESAHAAGVVHRDLKPQNIMLDPKDRVYVMDFGIAHSLETPGMTQTGALMGTPEYMSPEQAKGIKVDARSDLFALGIILYELLTGISPYKADNALAMLLKRTQERPQPPAEVDPTIPKAISDVVMKCLEIERDQRFSNAREILEDLGLEMPTSVRTIAPTLPPSLPAAQTKKVSPFIQYRTWIIGGAAVLLFTTLGFAFRSTIFSAKRAAAVEQTSLAILPFRNASGDASLDWLGPSLADMLSTDVGQSARLRTISSDRLHQVLSDLRVSSGASIDAAMVGRIAEFSSADTVVWGQYAKFGDQIRIDATLQDLKHNRSTPLKIQAADEKEIPGTVDGLADLIRKNLAVSSDVLKELKASSFQPSSKSVPALRDYNQGLQLLRSGKNLEAVKMFQAAIQEDSQFALAYSHLAETDSALGYDEDADKYSSKAVDLSRQLPLGEKFMIEASHARVMKDKKKAIDAYENLAKTRPDDPDVEFALGELYVDTGALDKARAEFAKVLAHDPKQVEALYFAGRVEVMSDNVQSGLDYLNRALSLTVQLENDEEKAKILQGIGISYKFLNKLDDALRSYQESLAINRRLGQKSGASASLSEIAQIQRTMGKPDAALTSFNEALQLSREIGDKQGIAETLNDLGLLYDDRGNYDQALKLFKESLQLDRDTADETSQALLLNNIGHTYSLMADFDNARTYFEQALGLYEKFKSTREMADAVHNLAEISLKMGQYDRAQSQYLRALDLRRSAEDKRGAAMESSGLGTLFEYQGRYGAELASEEEAVKGFRDAQDHSLWMANVLSGYGHALSQVGRYDEAQKNLEEAFSLSRELKNQSLMAQTLNYQGDSFFYRGEFKSAGPLYEQGLQEASRGKDRNIVLLSKINLARLAVYERHSQTVAVTLKGLGQEADTLGLKYLSAECSVYLGEALLTARQYAGARQELETALRKSEKLGLKALLAEAHYLLAQTAQGNAGDPEAAVHLGEARRLLEEIRTESHNDMVVKRLDLQRITSNTSGKS